MSYLIVNDFKKAIQSDNLQSVINKDQSILDSAMLDAETVAKENLVQKYEIDKELTSTDIFENDEEYSATNRVYLDAPAYNPLATSYSVGDLVLQDGLIYRNHTAIVSAEAFDSSKWTLLGNQYQLFFVPYPNDLFDLNKFYNRGDQVGWNGRNYTALLPTPTIDHESLLQFGTYNNVPYLNVFPDNAQNGAQYWGAGTAVTVAADSLPTGWTEGDNRNRSLVRHMVAIALYIIHDRIAPRNVPELRARKYREAMMWLKDAGIGAITADIQKIQPRSGGRVRWGSKIKNNNSY